MKNHNISNTRSSNKTYIVKNKKNCSSNINNDISKNKRIFHTYLWYILLFSVIGLLVETIFCFITTGNIESRKGLFLGPLCPVYGVSAAFIIAILGKYKGNKIKLFIYGTLLGGVIEYVISFILEAIYGARFWDYSWLSYNLNGRICLIYSIFWGILTLILIDFLKKHIDTLITKMKGKASKVLDIILTVLLSIDILITIWAVSSYQARATRWLNDEDFISNNNIIEKLENTLFSNEIMKTIFPNLKMKNLSGTLIFVTEAFEK